MTVQVNGDTTVELDETFDVILSALSAGGRDVTIGTGTGVGTITNDDSATIAINNVTLNEGDSGTTAFTFDITLDNPVDVPVSLQADSVPMAPQRLPTTTMWPWLPTQSTSPPTRRRPNR